MTHKIQIDAAPPLVGSRYPQPYAMPCQDRARRQLGDAAGLTQFGVNPLALEVGTRSASPDAELVDYPDIDMQVRGGRFVHRDGRPYAQPPPTPAPATRR